jgi:imidazole glycerol-phosphate synthase subunit HisF
MAYKRIIPNFLLVNGEFYTSKKYKKLSYIGEPRNIISILLNKGVDELLITPKGYTRFDDVFNDIRDIISLCDVPVSVQGGVETTKQAEKLYDSGVEKIFFHNAVLQETPVYEKIVAQYGRQAVGISLVVQKLLFSSQYRYFSMRSQRQLSGSQLKNLARNLEKRQFIEIILNDLSSDGCFSGWRGTEILKTLEGQAIIPSCGIKSYAEISELLAFNNVVGVSASSLFSYSGLNKGVLVNYPNRQDLERGRIYGDL